MREIKAYGRGISSIHGEDFLEEHAKPITEGLLHLQKYIQGLMKGEVDKSDYHRMMILQAQLGDIARILGYRKVNPGSPRGSGEGAKNKLCTALGAVVVHITFLCEILGIDLWSVVHEELDRMDNSIWRDS